MHIIMAARSVAVKQLEHVVSVKEKTLTDYRSSMSSLGCIKPTASSTKRSIVKHVDIVRKRTLTLSD